MNNKAFESILKLALVGCLGAFVSGCNQANSEVTNDVIKPVKLYQVPSAIGSAHDAFLAEVDAGERSQLSFQVPGVIETLNVKQGEKVEKGQVLALLDASDYQLAVDAAQAQYDLAETRLERDKQLIKKKLISADTFDQTETDFKAAGANLEEAKTDLRYTQIKAPFDGIVSLKFVQTHEFVGAKQPVLNVINNETLDINISLPVPYVERTGIQTLPEKAYAVVFDIHSSIVIPARFKEMSTQPDIDTNSYKATVTLLRPDSLNILTGMTGQVLIGNESKESTYTLPDDAWISKQGTQGEVWRFNPDDQTVESITLVLDGQGAVLSGLNAGDMIVTAGAKNLREGQQVRAWEREGGI